MFDLANSMSSFDCVQRERRELGDEEIIRSLCEEVLAEAEAEPPVPVERIASLRGISRIARVSQPWAGMLYAEDRALKIALRLSDSYERQRFTVCHETGHTLFAGFREAVRYRCNGEQTLLERRCDIAATELLLPRRYFALDLEEVGFGLEQTEELARRYEASIEATGRRIVNLSSSPAALLVFSQRHKPTEAGKEHLADPKLRLDYCHARGRWPFLRLHKSVPDQSPFGRAFAGELTHEHGGLGDLTDETLDAEIHARRYGPRVLALIRRPQIS